MNGHTWPATLHHVERANAYWSSNSSSRTASGATIRGRRGCRQHRHRVGRGRAHGGAARWPAAATACWCWSSTTCRAAGATASRWAATSSAPACTTWARWAPTPTCGDHVRRHRLRQGSLGNMERDGQRVSHDRGLDRKVAHSRRVSDQVVRFSRGAQRCQVFFMAQITVRQARSASEWVCGDASGSTRLRFVLVSVSKNASQRYA